MMAALLCVLVLAGTGWAEEAPQEIHDLAGATLMELASDPAIVAAVQAQNGEGLTDREIEGRDRTWQDAAGIDSFIQSLMDNDCSKRLLEIQNSEPYYAEIFVMDNKGANVCLTDKTSDYWQGDEAKFQESFASGAGAVFVDEVEFDNSAQAYLVQVSVPVMQGGSAIGAVTFGIDLDAFEQQ